MTTPPELEITIEHIREFHRQRKFAMNVRKKVDNATKAFLRTMLGYRTDMSKAQRDAIAATANAAFRVAEAAALAARKGEPFETDNAFYLSQRVVLDPAMAAREPFDDFEDENERAMRKLVRKLPIWTGWAKDTKGVGENTIGSIVGECGDLSNYATEAKLTKRLGLAVIDGVRQGGLLKTAKAEDWTRHGYSGQRRSILFNFSDSVIKCGGPYRALYDLQKAREIAKAEAKGLTVLPAADIAKLVKGGADAKKFMSVGHVHRRTCRWVEKRFLRHLWREWNALHGANLVVSERTCHALPQAA